MTQQSNVQTGALAEDSEEDDGDTMIVISVSEVSCDDEDEAFVRWDYNMNPVTVADENEDYDPSQPFASVVFLPQLDRKWPNWRNQDIEFLQDKVEDEQVKLYKYPVNRIRVTGTQF